MSLIMGWRRRAENALDPFLTPLYASPLVALALLLIIVFGVGVLGKAALVFLLSIFPFVFNTFAGVKNVNQVLVNVVRSFSASEWQLMKVVVIPNSLPYIIAGLRVAIGRAILGVVVGEFFGSSQGLGYMIASAVTNYKVDVVFVSVTIFIALSVILTLAVKRRESRLASWRPETAKTF